MSKKNESFIGKDSKINISQMHNENGHRTFVRNRLNCHRDYTPHNHVFDAVRYARGGMMSAEQIEKLMSSIRTPNIHEGISIKAGIRNVLDGLIIDKESIIKLKPLKSTLKSITDKILEKKMKEETEFKFTTTLLDLGEVSDNLTRRHPIIIVQTDDYKAKCFVLFHKCIYQKSRMLKGEIFESLELDNGHRAVFCDNAKRIPPVTKWIKSIVREKVGTKVTYNVKMMEV